MSGGAWLSVPALGLGILSPPPAPQHSVHPACAGRIFLFLFLMMRLSNIDVN